MGEGAAFNWSYDSSGHGRTPSSQGRVGQRIGPYEVVAHLGSGGVGAVLGVKDANGRKLALKILTTPSPDRIARFLREGEVTAALRHPGIIAIHDAGEHQDRPYLVYELVEGRDLEAAMEELAREDLVRIVREVAEALGHAHEQGVLHRDVKPSNILIDPGGRALLADFGLAQIADQERLTKTGAFLGTPHYMSPEQATGQRESYGPPTDVWSLGVLLYRALTGELPFVADDLTSLLARITSVEAPPPHEVAPDVPRDLSAVCMKALQKDPAARYADGKQLALDLARAESGERVLAPSSDARRRWALIAAALIPVACVAVAVTLAVPRRLAAKAVESHASWAAEALEPAGLNVLGDADLDLQDLQARLAALREVAKRSPERAAPHLELLECHVRLLRARAGEAVEVPERTSGRTPQELTVDALILRARGSKGAARSRLERALRRDPEFAPAKLALYLDQVEDEPRRLIASARQDDAQARRVLNARWTRLLDQLVAASAQDAEQVDQAKALAAAVEAEPSERRAAVCASLDRSATSWAAALAQAFAVERERHLVDRLEGILRAWSTRRMGAEASLALGAILDRVTKELDQEKTTNDPRLLRLVALENRLHYLCTDLPTPSGYMGVMTTILGTNDRSGMTSEQRLAGALAGLRFAEGLRSDAAETVAPYPDLCEAWRKEHPESRAGALLQAMIELDEIRKDRTRFPEGIELLEHAVSAPYEDLSPPHQLLAWIELAALRLRKLSRTSPVREDLRLWEVLKIAQREASKQRNLERLREALVMEREAQQVLEGPRASLKGWPQALAEFKRVSEGVKGRASLDSRQPVTEYGILLMKYAEALSRSGQHRKAASKAREAFRAVLRGEDVQGMFSRNSIGQVPAQASNSLLRVSSRADELPAALDLLQPLEKAIKSSHRQGKRKDVYTLYLAALRQAGRAAQADALEAAD